MFKGEITPTDAFEKLQSGGKCVLVDVRTTAEWAFVGIPAIDGLVRVQWQEFPHMQVNSSFIEQIETAGVEKDAEVLLICRSGQRSAHAAAALTTAGFANCYNVLEGFEGDRDQNGHRGTVNGWKHAGLPWIQG